MILSIKIIILQKLDKVVGKYVRISIATQTSELLIHVVKKLQATSLLSYLHVIDMKRN